MIQPFLKTYGIFVKGNLRKIERTSLDSLPPLKVQSTYVAE
jgi:hypothetical protein